MVLWCVVGCLLLTGCARGEQRDDWSNDLYWEHLIVIVTTCVLMGVGWVVGVGCIVVRGWLIKLPALIFVVAISSVIPAGTVAWGVTYSAARDILQEKSEEQLNTTARNIASAVSLELDIGVGILDLTASMIEEGSFTTSTPHPAPHAHFLRLMDTVGSSSRSIEQMYYGTQQGRLVGAGIGRTPSGSRHLSGLLPGDPIPYNGTCLKKDYLPTCTTTPTPCTDPLTAHECALHCDGPGDSSAACVGFNSSDPRLLLFYADRADASLLPDPSQPTGIETIKFDPRTRPWYALSTEPLWSEVYVFSGAQGGSGFTVSLGVQGAGGTWEGVLAVDYSLHSLGPLLAGAKFTSGVLIQIVTLQGVLVSSSMPTDQIEATVGVSLTDSLLDVFQLPKDSKLRAPFSAVLARYGSMEAASEESAILQEDSTIILLHPIEIKGGLRLVMTISLPYSDVMGKADAASTTALLLAVSISIVCGVLMYAGVGFVLRPLQDLAEDMNEVAWMRLDAVYLERGLSSIYEVAWMQKSFRLMVKNLTEYREYLPQTVLLDDESSADQWTDPVVDAVPEKPEKPESPRNKAFRQHLVKKNVTLLVANVRNFNPMSLLVGFGERFEGYLSTVVEVTHVYDGIIDSFNGDKVLVHFNASRHCTRHRASAVKCARRVCAAVKEKNTFPEVNMGIAGGDAVCGDLGCKTLKKHCVVGRVATVAYVVERMGCKHDLDVACSGDIASDTSKAFEHRAAAVVKLTQLLRPVLVYEVTGRVPTDEEQWLYEAHTGDASWPTYAAFNSAFVLMWDGSPREALAALSKSNLPQHDPQLRAQIESFIRSPQPVPVFCP